MYLVTSEQMQALDRRTIDTLGVPGILLMEHAGKSVAAEVMTHNPSETTILCGKGNNGGDGWIVARWLKHWGVSNVQVLSVVPVAELTGDAALAAGMAVSSGVAYQVWQPGQTLPEADVFVDALLGTGTSRPLQGPLAELVTAVNSMSPCTVAVDVPSGVDASTGVVAGPAVRAHVTVAIQAQKLGTAVSPGCHYAGRVTVADIGIDMSHVEGLAARVTAESLESVLPKRMPESHKGTYGRIGIVVGEMQGAAVLAGLGAARSGAGLVAMGVVEALRVAVPPEFIVRIADPGQPWAVFQDCSALVLGPGLGCGGLWLLPVSVPGRGVLDADGLGLLERHTFEPGQWVLTPHPKECGQLLGWTTERVQQHRLKAAQSLAAETGQTVVLKGHHSIVAHPEGTVRVNPTGDASLATAGTGDVLAGVIGGLMGQGLDPLAAAAAGVWMHGRAGELAGQTLSKASVMASDVVENISRTIRLHFDRDLGSQQ